MEPAGLRTSKSRYRAPTSASSRASSTSRSCAPRASRLEARSRSISRQRAAHRPACAPGHVRGSQFTPVNESVTFPAGQSTETVAVPINSRAANPGLVPIELAVTIVDAPGKGKHDDGLPGEQRERHPAFDHRRPASCRGHCHHFQQADGPGDGAEHPQLRGQVLAESEFQPRKLVRGRSGPNPQYSQRRRFPFERATYNPATNTVLWSRPSSSGRKVRTRSASPASLLAKKARPSNAQSTHRPRRQCARQGGSGGTFSITISKGKPYAAAADPAIWARLTLHISRTTSARVRSGRGAVQRWQS